MAKIRYIEIKPVQQTLEFENQESWHEFFEKRIKEIIDYTYANNIRYQDYYEYHRVLLNKNGTPRKPINPDWLHSKKAQANQKKNFAEYCEKRKQQTAERSYRRQKAEILFKIEYWQKQLQELEDEQKQNL